MLSRSNIDSDSNCLELTAKLVQLFVSVFLLLRGEAILAETNEPRADFSGQTIEVTVPFLQGGGTDTWARSVLPLLSPYLPGHPEVLIKNVAGSSATKAANDFADSAKADGLSILVTGASNHLAYVLGDDRVRYEFDRWSALMAYRAGMVVYASPTVGVESICDLTTLQSRQLILASISPASEDLFVLLALDLIGIEVSSVFGLRGRATARKFYERGDANIDFQTTAAYQTYVQPKVEAGLAVPLFSLGAFDADMRYVRDPMFPELPNLAEAIECASGNAPAGDAWDAWLTLYKSGLGSLKLVVVPSDTPRSIVDAYSVAAEKLTNDPRYQSSVEKQIGPKSLLTAEGAESLMPSRASIPLEVRQWLKNWVFEKYEVRL